MVDAKGIARKVHSPVIKEKLNISGFTVICNSETLDDESGLLSTVKIYHPTLYALPHFELTYFEDDETFHIAHCYNLVESSVKLTQFEEVYVCKIDAKTPLDEAKIIKILEECIVNTFRGNLQELKREGINQSKYK